jgi:hypothetical protein
MDCGPDSDGDDLNNLEECEAETSPLDAGSTTTRNVPLTAAPLRFFVIEAVKPLQP